MMLMITGCGQIEYRSSEAIPISYGLNKNHQQQFKAEVTSDFYFFGAFPEREYVFIDQLAKSSGFEEISRPNIAEKVSFENILLTIFSFGLYTPKTVEITAWAK
ncbi:MAG: hypothetical protein HQK50_12675 [Oligoflexia bacterium]|nr:hypothetical protein [Oligoflexia bacterium]